MLHKLGTARKLSRAEWGGFLQAWTLLLAVDLGLRLLPFPRLRAWAAPKSDAYSQNISDEAARAQIRQVRARVAQAARNHLYPMTCLRRSLVLQRMLRRRGIPTELRLGVRKEDGTLQAHAWLEYQGQPVGEAEDLGEKYAGLVNYSPGAKP
jgi:hypothetical protein